MNEVVPQTLPLRDSQPIDTSGTVGTTIVDTISVIESAARRCGKQPTSLTAENLDTAKTNLFFLLSRLATRGLNLWAVDQSYIPIVPGKVRYALPTGTEDIVKITYRTPRALSVTKPAGNDLTLMLDAERAVKLLGFKLAQTFSGYLTIETTQDGTTWDKYADYDEVTLSPGWQWLVVDPALPCTGVRVRYANGGDFASLVSDSLVADSYNDDPLTRFNRDMYTDLNNKTAAGKPSTFYFEKKIECAISFWPVPDDEHRHFVVWRHRAIQDVGSLMNRLELPSRWYDAISWMLAKNLAYELDGVPPDRIALVETNAANAESAAELGENDGAPMYLKPNISGYTA